MIRNFFLIDVDWIVPSMRRMFDLDAVPGAIGTAMSADPYLAEIWSRYSGLRVFRVGNEFGSLVATVLGQLVSVRFGRVLLSELMVAGVG